MIEALGLIVRQGTSPVSFEAITGIALRRNPKRAHLLISKVLGKHYPQSPALIGAAAQILSHQVRSHLAGQADDKTTALLVDELTAALRDPGPRVRLSRLDRDGPGRRIAVIGYAEAATSLGASVAMDLGAYYVTSTRYPDSKVDAYGAFQEEHSHASSHFLTPTDRTVLDDPGSVVVLVDDELTTGRTIMNTIRMLQAVASHTVYVVATLADLREQDSRTALDVFAIEEGVSVTVVSLFAGQLTVPASTLENVGPVIERISAEPCAIVPRERPASVEYVSFPFGAPVPRNGIADFRELEDLAATLADDLSRRVVGRTLMLGIEEDMVLPLRVASVLERVHPHDVLFGSTTRSPAVASTSPGYGIRDRIVYSVPGVPGDTPVRFSYNLGGDFESIVIITGSAAESARLRDTSQSLLAALAWRTAHIFVVEAVAGPHTLPEPLRGPAFGSYPPDDVAWLLKDLSGCALETSVEDREEAIQNGGMHYAETLPVEYQPSAEYQDLFSDSLERTKESLALHVGVLSEQILALQPGGPVLVSLARAGTPVGVLLRRYLKAAHGLEVPHYAVSIVRGRGIDPNALTYLAAHHDPAAVMFVDGWTGKGAIVRELASALDVYEKRTGVRFSPELAVLADPGFAASVYGTREDYLIPSASLNSTVSGLVSRTVLNAALIGVDDYHGAKFYAEFIEQDVSNIFVDAVSSLFMPALFDRVHQTAEFHAAVAPDWSGWAAVERISAEYGINNVNLVKPGVGETTRVLLRRVPWRVLVSDAASPRVAHILLLAASKGVLVEVVPNLPFVAVGLIHPRHTRGAVGSDGKSAA